MFGIRIMARAQDRPGGSLRVCPWCGITVNASEERCRSAGQRVRPGGAPPALADALGLAARRVPSARVVGALIGLRGPMQVSRICAPPTRVVMRHVLCSRDLDSRSKHYRRLLFMERAQVGPAWPAGGIASPMTPRSLGAMGSRSDGGGVRGRDLRGRCSAESQHC